METILRNEASSAGNARWGGGWSFRAPGRGSGARARGRPGNGPAGKAGTTRFRVRSPDGEIKAGDAVEGRAAARHTMTNEPNRSGRRAWRPGGPGRRMAALDGGQANARARRRRRPGGSSADARSGVVTLPGRTIKGAPPAMRRSALMKNGGCQPR